MDTSIKVTTIEAGAFARGAIRRELALLSPLGITYEEKKMLFESVFVVRVPKAAAAEYNLLIERIAYNFTQKWRTTNVPKGQVRAFRKALSARGISYTKVKHSSSVEFTYYTTDSQHYSAIAASRY